MYTIKLNSQHLRGKGSVLQGGANTFLLTELRFTQGAGWVTPFQVIRSKGADFPENRKAGIRNGSEPQSSVL